ncbi:unnamed protein product [Schistocephalus solidus]|uniref:HEAT repeat-containing protein 6 n=1 Tax=Schistocephalus solidus TaxID=70667 RepID=A0A183SVK8_SCHSO|nr:unnamed protein product [Schistocephalus solidus]
MVYYVVMIHHILRNWTQKYKLTCIDSLSAKVDSRENFFDAPGQFLKRRVSTALVNAFAAPKIVVQKTTQATLEPKKQPENNAKSIKTEDRIFLLKELLPSLLTLSASLVLSKRPPVRHRAALMYALAASFLTAEVIPNQNPSCVVLPDVCYITTLLLAHPSAGIRRDACSILTATITKLKDSQQELRNIVAYLTQDWSPNQEVLLTPMKNVNRETNSKKATAWTLGHLQAYCSVCRLLVENDLQTEAACLLAKTACNALHVDWSHLMLETPRENFSGVWAAHRPSGISGAMFKRNSETSSLNDSQNGFPYSPGYAGPRSPFGGSRIRESELESPLSEEVVGTAGTRPNFDFRSSLIIIIHASIEYLCDPSRELAQLAHEVGLFTCVICT